MLSYASVVDDLLATLPEIKPRFEEEGKCWDEVLQHIVFGDVVVPFVLELLSDESEQAMLERVFAFFENMATSPDDMVSELLTVSVLEQLGDDAAVRAKAMHYMGRNTKKLSDAMEKGLGRA